MKYFRSFLFVFFVWVVSFTISTAQTLELTIVNAHYSGTTFLFDIYLRATSGTVYLGGADLVLTFNSENFLSPTVTKGLNNTFILNNTLGDNTTSVGGSVGALYRSNVSTAPITSNELIINLSGLSISDQPTFDSDVALIDNNPYKFGTYTVTGITNPAGTMGLAWKTAGGGVTTKVYTLANTTPWAQTLVALSTPIITDSPLPVELTSFTSKFLNDKVQLNWETKTEINNYGFDIERKVNGDWQKIGFIEGNGNSSSPKEYSFTDNKLVGGSKYQYRLKQIDNDGQFEYSDVIEVVNVPTEFALYQNYPNPFNPSTKIRYQLPNESKVVIKIYNILGSEVMELLNEQKKAGVYEVNFNADNLSSGTYIYKINADNFVQTKKMILIK